MADQKIVGKWHCKEDVLNDGSYYIYDEYVLDILSVRVDAQGGAVDQHYKVKKGDDWQMSAAVYDLLVLKPLPQKPNAVQLQSTYQRCIEGGRVDDHGWCGLAESIDGANIAIEMEGERLKFVNLTKGNIMYLDRAGVDADVVGVDADVVGVDADVNADDIDQMRRHAGATALGGAAKLGT